MKKNFGFPLNNHTQIKRKHNFMPFSFQKCGNLSFYNPGNDTEMNKIAIHPLPNYSKWDFQFVTRYNMLTTNSIYAFHVILLNQGGNTSSTTKSLVKGNKYYDLQYYFLKNDVKLVQ